MAIICEGCGVTNPKTYERGPFQGMVMELEYCKHCYQDLCDDCIENGECEDNPILGHEVEEEDDDYEQFGET